MAKTKKERATRVSKARPLTKRQRNDMTLTQLKLERSSFETLWSQLGDYIMPQRVRLNLSDNNRGNRGSVKIIDSTATLAAGTLSSGMMAGVTSPARPWFRLTLSDQELAELERVKTWLHDVGERMSTVFLRSNLYKILPITYGDLGTFGTSAFFVAEDEETVIHCTHFPIGSYWIGCDSKGRVRVFAREYRMTVRQVVEQFGRLTPSGDPDWSNFSTAVQSAWNDGQLDTPIVDVVHIIAPNPYHDGAKQDNKSMRYTACYYEKAGTDDRLLEEKGFNDFPVMAPRWETTGSDTYGTSSPGIRALPDVKQLQLGEKRGMQAIERMANPPMVASDAVDATKLSVLPGETSFVPDKEAKGFRPAYEYGLNPRIQELEGKQGQVRYRVQRAYFEDLFLMLAQGAAKDRKDITATEIIERKEEKLLALGPVLEQLNGDVLDPLIDRTFNIMLRLGLIPEPPEELVGQAIKVEYISVMAQAQKAVGLAAVERVLGFVLQMADSGDLTVWDKVDRDQMIDEVGMMTGVAPRIIRPDDQVAEIRAKRAQAQQAAEQAKVMKDVAGSAKQLSEADTERPSALRDLIDSAGAGGQQ